MTSVLLIPLDGRPCNHVFPRELAALAGFSLSCPQKELLGDAQKPARRDRIGAWLKHQLTQAETLLVSLDTWIYGNLVASRKSTESLASLGARLEQLSDIKKIHPKLKIQAFATLLRISNSNDATEERQYWAEYGQRIYRFSWLEHYLQTHVNDQKCQAEFEYLKTTLPDKILSDYRALRQRNFSLLLQALNLVQKGVLETLLIGCDDSGDYGWNALERQQLLNEIEIQSLQQKVLLYPGADELAQVLLGRSLIQTKPRLGIRWTHPEAKNLNTRYEGIPLRDTLQYQAQACQVNVSENSDDDCDAILWLHNPPSEQIDQFLNRTDRVSGSPEQITPLFDLLKQDKPVLIADLMYANGGDAYLLKQLENEQLLFHPKAYAAWNTNGNTLGTVLAWYKLLNAEQVQPHLQQKFLIERITDDGWYQGIWRQELSKHYSDPVNLNTCVQLIHKMNEHLKCWQQWMPESPHCLQVKHLNFPWRRFFEIELELCFKSQSDDSA